MKNNGHLYFEIHAEDLSRAKKFYTGVFGWSFTKATGLPIEYWRIETGGARGGLLKRPANTPPQMCGANSFVCSVQVDDFDATAKKILKRGGIVALPKFAVPKTCWHGYFFDAEGNVFGIFEVDTKAK
jgi:predicted enzyme related to lactoylglutathione lyase